MRTKESRAARWRGWWAYSTVVALTGVYLVLVPLGDPLRRMSYDLPFLTTPAVRHTNVVFVYVDDISLRDLGRRPDGGLDRRWYVKLLQRLTADKARLVLFDIAFTRSDESDETDRELAAALRANGRSVLASTHEAVLEGNMILGRMLSPDARFGTNAAAVGVAFLEPDPDHVVRSLPTELKGEDSFVWAAARLVDAWPAGSDRNRERERFLRHYRPPSQAQTAFEERSIRETVASNGLPSGFFRDKTVFVGARRSVGPIGEERDRFATPFSARVKSWPDSPGVALHATAFVNLERDDWIEPIGLAGGIMFVLFAGLLVSLALFHLRPFVALLTGSGCAAVLAAIGVLVQERAGLSLPWAITLTVQLPLAMVWAWGRNWFKPGRPQVFISYRRSEGEGSGYALGLFHALRAHGIESHWDVVSIDSGGWKDQLGLHIDEVPNFILLVTKGSLNPERINRIDGKDDMFRWEIERAHQRKKNIIVVLIDRAKIPTWDEPLPASLAWLQDQDQQPQTWTYRHDDAMRLADIVLPRLQQRGVLGRMWHAVLLRDSRRA